MSDEKIIEMLREDIAEIKASMKDLQKQMTALVASRHVTEAECETRRRNCCRGGIPPWVAVVVTMTGALLGYTITTLAGR